MPSATLRVVCPGLCPGTQNVQDGIPTRSVGTREPPPGSCYVQPSPPREEEDRTSFPRSSVGTREPPPGSCYVQSYVKTAVVLDEDSRKRLLFDSHVARLVDLEVHGIRAALDLGDDTGLLGVGELLGDDVPPLDAAPVGEGVVVALGGARRGSGGVLGLGLHVAIG